MYGKVFESMFDGTLASRGPWQALVTFQQMIVLANRDGMVDMTAEAIARRTSIPLEIIEIGIAELMKPDSRSRSPDEEGRRIVLIDDHRDWGWIIVNHAKYQALRSADERREYMRVAQSKRRERIRIESSSMSTLVKNVNTVSSNVSTSTPTPASIPAPEPESSKKELSTPSVSHPAGPGKASPTGKPARLPPCPYERVVLIYHEVLPELPRVKVMDDERKRLMAKLWTFILTSPKGDGCPRADDVEGGMTWLRGYFDHTRQNDFVMGRTARSEEHRNWKASLDYLCTSKGVKQVLEKTQDAA